MLKKITFVRGGARTPGIRPRCKKRHEKTHAHCDKPEGHTQNCRWSIAILPRKEKAARTNTLRLSKETRLSCLDMIEDPAYRKKLLIDLRKRKLRPAVECMLWYYAKGKPKEMVEHSGTLSLQQELGALTPEQLRQRALDVAKMLTSTVH